MYGFFRLTISIHFSKLCRSFFQSFYSYFFLSPVLVTLQDSTMNTIPCHPLKSCLNTNHFFLSACFCWWQKPLPSLRLHNSLQICKDEPFRLSSWSTPEQLLIPSVPNTPLNNNLIIYNHTLSNITPKHSYSYFKEILQCQILDVCFQKALKEKWVTASF